MKDIRRIKTNIPTVSFEFLGSELYYYNYDIQTEEEMEKGDWNEDSEWVPVTKYSFAQVMLKGVPNYKTCVKAVIRMYLSVDDEFDIINTANRQLKNGEPTPEYDEYLELLNTIKAKVRADIDALYEPKEEPQPENDEV